MADNSNNIFIGIDVAQDHIDIHINPERHYRRFNNTETGLEQAATWIKSYGNGKIVCENTGGLETMMVSVFRKQGLKVHAVNPNRINAYRLACAQNAKTDLLDAALIASFAEKMDITEKMPLSAAEEELKMLATRRRQVVEMQVQDRNRLGRTHLQRAKDSIKNFIEKFQKERELFEMEMKRVIEKDKKLKRRFDILKSIPGVGDITALTLVSEMPELGLINDKKIASLAGVAPHNRDSGRIRDNARIRGGRKCARAVLYMSAMAARRSNPAIKTFYERLVDNGKPKKKALIAAMRKLLVHCNHMIANDTFYTPPSESDLNRQKNTII